jgi:small subunit ribosomal protein S3Ae
VAGLCFRKTTEAQEKSIRKLLSDMLVSKGEEYDLKQYILELLVVGNIVKDAMTKIKEIYPLKRIEIIKTRVLA